MKKYVAMLLSILFLLSGCSHSTAYEKPASFYYCSATFQYESGDSAIVAEIRESAGCSTLEEIMQLYLAGPDNVELVSPFPNGLRLISHHQEGETLYLLFSEELSQLSNLSLSMACGCITMTCLTLTDATQVTIEANESLLDGHKSITMEQDSLILSDHAAEGK